MGRYFWSEEEIDFVENNYKKIPNKQIAIKLGRSEDSIRVKISKLGLSSPKVLKKKCLNCGKEFTTKIKTQNYCSAKCRCKQATIRQQQAFQKKRKEIYAKRAEKRKELKIQREKNIASNKKKKSLTAFFELHCLSSDTREGIEKIKRFTHRKDAERIYRLLRANFMKSKSI